MVIQLSSKPTKDSVFLALLSHFLLIHLLSDSKMLLLTSVILFSSTFSLMSFKKKKKKVLLTVFFMGFLKRKRKIWCTFSVCHLDTEIIINAFYIANIIAFYKGEKIKMSIK